MLSSGQSHFLLVEDREDGGLEIWCQLKGIHVHVCRGPMEVRALSSEIVSGATGVLLGLSQPRETLATLAMVRGTRGLRHLPAVVVLPLGATNITDSLQRLGVFLYLKRPFIDQALEGALEAAGTYRAIVASKHPDAEPTGSAALGQLLREGVFHVRTPEEATALAEALAAACPDPGRQMCGIHELLMNAIEHGNLGVSNESKAQLLRQGLWRDELNRRLELPEYRDKLVTVSLQRQANQVVLSVRDQGAGFDWRTAMAKSIESASGPNGRGIMLARMLSFDHLEYRDPGNEAIAYVRIRTVSSDKIAAVIDVAAAEPGSGEVLRTACGTECASALELKACKALVAPAAPAALADEVADPAANEPVDLAATIDRLVREHNEVTQHLDEIKREQVLADKVLANVRRQGCLDAPGIRYVIASLEFFNGDIALAAQTPTGELRWLLGDFTGHGLSAAIGSIPVASAFYATSKKNIPFAEVVATINDMLKGLLPPGLFCAASMLALSPDSSSLSIWNGGLPAVLVRRARDGSLQEFPSQALPLGLVSSAELGVTLEQVAVERGDEIFVYSDGLTEASNTAGELFSGERLEAALRSVSKTGEAFDRLLAEVTAFRGGARASDDVSLVTVTVGETAVPKPRATRARSRDLKSRELRPPTRPSERPQ